ncbi:MAG TPA: isochorismatase family protein [Candidatus Acidoferrum sp.]|nr:isochorismatase family protein [Candidatus Acidoferrum sp.]
MRKLVALAAARSVAGFTLASLMLAAVTLPARAQTVIDEWSSVKPPQPPAVGKLLAAARSSGATVIYSITMTSTLSDLLPPVARNANEPYVQTGPDKFIHTDLEKLLADKGIKTVIITGTTAEGAVLYTASHAALLGYNVVLPVDGLSATTLYAEQYVTWNMVHAPGVLTKTKETTTTQISF